MITHKSDKRKQSLYFPETMLEEIKAEANRLDRSISWVVQRAWRIARTDIKKLPSATDVDALRAPVKAVPPSPLDLLDDAIPNRMALLVLLCETCR